MPPDDQQSQNESSRKMLLEEIRRRAEEAETRRLEDEDKKRTGGDRGSQPPSSAPFPETAAETPAASNKAAVEQKVLVLRERLLSALERNKAEKATELFTELSKLIPDDPNLPELKERVLALQEQRARTGMSDRRPSELGPPRMRPSETRPSESRPSEARPSGMRSSGMRQTGSRPPETRQRASGADKAEREARKKKIADMMEAGNNYYQQEKYEKAIQYVNEVLNLDPENGPAISLRQQIVKARELESAVRKEDDRRRAEDRASRPTKVVEDVPQVPSSGRPTDFWGASPSGPKLGSEYDLLPEEKGPVGPPPPPMSQRLARRISSISIPVKPLLMIGAVAALAVAVWYIVDAIRNTVAPPLNSVLVLPASPSSDSSLTVLADGFAEELIADMARVPEMRVIAPATAFAFASSPLPPGQIARALGASYVLSWTINRAGEKIALQFVFSDTMSVTPAWSSTVQVAGREIPALKPEIMRSLASAMKVKLIGNDGSSILSTPAANDVAYAYYARGRALLREGDDFAPEEAIALFDQAIQLDPEYGAAHAASGLAHMLAYETSPEMPPAHISMALTEVQKALGTGLRTSEVFRAWGLAEQAHGQYLKAIDRFEQAVNVAPSDAESQRRLAVAYAATGKLEQAVKASLRSVADDPGNISAHTILGEMYQFRAVHTLDNRDDYRAALRAYEQGLHLARDKSEYAAASYADVLVLLQQTDRAINVLIDRVARVRESYLDEYRLGRVEQSAGKPINVWQQAFIRARGILTNYLAASGNDAIAEAYLALVNTRLGAFKEAVVAIGNAQRIAPTDPDVLYLTARMYALQKDKAKALEYLRKAIARRFSLASILDLDFFNLYSEPEFVAALTSRE
jgi:tetratricopeptide (TPR) repeat protein